MSSRSIATLEKATDLSVSTASSGSVGRLSTSPDPPSAPTTRGPRPDTDHPTHSPPAPPRLAPPHPPAPTAGAAASDRLPPHSRYAATEIVTDLESDGTERRHLKRRFLPSGDDSATVAQHLVVAEDRLDALAQHYYGDPLLAWRIADGRSDSANAL